PRCSGGCGSCFLLVVGVDDLPGVNGACLLAVLGCGLDGDHLPLPLCRRTLGLAPVGERAGEGPARVPVVPADLVAHAFTWAPPAAACWHSDRPHVTL